MRPNLITRLKEEWNNLDPVDPLRGLISDAIDALAEKPAQQQEPVAWIDEFGNVFPLGAQRGPKYLNEPMKPLYTSPQPSQRSVKPLTDAQIGAVAADIWGSVLIAPQSYQAFARAIEAKLKEKNQ